MATTKTSEYLKTAVHHNKALSKQGIFERMFTAWFKGFVYNQIWEDPRVDAEALHLDQNSKILCISSAGCNVLNYLVHSPSKIVAIDLNSNHLALTRLKIEALRRLPDYDRFFQFFGQAKERANLALYREYIRPHLDEDTIRFWESRDRRIRRLFGKRRINYFAKGLYDYGKLGLFLRFVHRVAKITKNDPERLLRAKSKEDQEKFFNEVIAPFFDHPFVRWLGRKQMTVYSLGIPPSQYDVMFNESNGEIVELYRQRVWKLAVQFPMEDNYFTWQAFGRRYDLENRKALPDYLREENYATLKANVDVVETHNRSLHDYLREQEPGALNRFVFLDSQDWMPAPVIEDLWSQVARVGEKGTRIIFRTAGMASPVEDALGPEVAPRFTYERELSQDLHDQDRSAIYGGFHVYSLND